MLCVIAVLDEPVELAVLLDVPDELELLEPDELDLLEPLDELELLEPDELELLEPDEAAELALPAPALVVDFLPAAIIFSTPQMQKMQHRQMPME